MRGKTGRSIVTYLLTFILVLGVYTINSHSSDVQDSLVGEIVNNEGTYIPHSPIVISSNSDFQTQASSEGWNGSGTLGDPYIIENYEIDGAGSSCINIVDTTVNFIIRNCSLHSGSHGVSLSWVMNSNITDNTIKMCNWGVYTELGGNVNVTHNHIDNGTWGIVVTSYDSVNVYDNIVTNHTTAIYYSDFFGFTSSRILNNNVHDNSVGFSFNMVYDIVCFGNSIYNNDLGFEFFNTFSNSFYNNNIINNTIQILNPIGEFQSNSWDNGYPYGGNYWSDYLGVDLFRGNNQDIPGPDRIGDSEYSIPDSNPDRYPLMMPCGTGPVHNVDTNERFHGIQVAIDDYDTLNGHTIEVSAGTYYGFIRINKALNLIGEDKYSTILNGNQISDVVIVASDNVTIQGFTIHNSKPEYPGYGIRVGNPGSCSYITIQDNIIRNNVFGIRYCWGFHSLIKNNEFFDNSIGIRLDYDGNLTVTQNYIFDNSHDGIFIGGNTISNVSIISNTIINNAWENVDYAGIRAHGLNHNFSDNYIADNNNGIILERVDNLTIANNKIVSNLIGIKVWPSANNNTIFHNLFNNTNTNAVDDGINNWDDGYPSGGNYWSDYTGNDLYSTPAQNVPPPDGIGDWRYLIDPTSKDNYPLMRPFEYEFNNCNYPVLEGWNLVSLPLEQPDGSIDIALSSINGKWDCIQAYDPLNPEPWKSTNIYRPDQLNDIATLDHTMGFWINITELNVNLTVSGYMPTSTSIPLYAGWNLVGYPTLTEKSIADALWGTGADKVEVFDPAEPYRIKEVGPTHMMKPGEGYWVHLPADTVWIVDW